MKMLFRLIVTTLMILQPVGARLNTSGQSHPAKPNADVHLYIPYVVNDPPLQIVILTIGFPLFSNFTVSGYVLNRTKQPFYGVQVDMRLSAFFTSPPSSGKIGAIVNTAFPASLPGQPNPFAFQLYSFSPNTVTLDSVEIYQALDKSPNDATYIALNASDWESKNSRITGTVRNETGVTVHDARVIVMISGTSKCYTGPGGFLVTTTLQPGQAQPYFAYGCDPMIVYPVAQGRISP